MKKANEEQATKFAGVFVEHHKLLTNAPSSDLQWAIQNPQDAVLLFVDALVARGKQAIAVVKKTLVPWKTIKIGGKPIEQVTTAITEKGNEIGSEASYIMGKPDFKVTHEEENVDLVKLTPADLGFTTMPRTDEFLTKEFCATWSAENLDGYVIELCHQEVGPQLRLQYQDQPKGETLWIAMERSTGSDGDPRVFGVERVDDGERWLYTRWTGPGDRWRLGSVVVFRLRKIT